MNLPIRTLGLAAAALLIGSSLAPAAAQQQQSGMDGQVAVRSDGALYLISNGQRRWVATVVASDEEINALPEGEPVYAGLAPGGSSSSASVGATKPTTSSQSSSSSKPGTSKPTASSSDDDDDDDDDDDSAEDDSDLSTDIPITVDISGSTNIKQGDSRSIEIKTRRELTCELKVEVPDDDPIEEDSKNADSRGLCKYTIEIPSGTKTGSAKIIGTVREGGAVNRQEIDIKIVKK